MISNAFILKTIRNLMQIARGIKRDVTIQPFQHFSGFPFIKMRPQMRIPHGFIKGAMACQSPKIGKARMAAIQDPDFGLFIRLDIIDNFDTDLC